MPRKSVCLNMIVKDEAHVIRRCLGSVRPLIDSWVIVDTGSSDGTQSLIREALRDLPGHLYEQPWKSFGHNRSQAIEFARSMADYLLFIDADDVMELPAGYVLPELDADAYEIDILHDNLLYRRMSLVSNRLPWRYVGVLHEYLDCGRDYRSARLPGPCMRYMGDGGRSQISQREKYARDAKILEQGLLEEPDNARYVFYLAQSYRDSGQPEKALAAYDRRATLGGFDQEVYRSMLEGGRLARQLGRPQAEIMDRLLRAYEARPRRVEALGELAVYCREQGPRWAQAQMFASRGLAIAPSEDILFVEHAWHEWRLLDEYAIACYWLGEYEASRTACEQLLRNDRLPAQQRSRVLDNLNHARRNLSLPPLPAPP